MCVGKKKNNLPKYSTRDCVMCVQIKNAKYATHLQREQEVKNRGNEYTGSIYV